MAKRRLIFAYSSFTSSTTLKAFTIVELLVVIVVIAILAAITIVSYSGITNRATIASIQSDLTNASTTLKMDQTLNDSFPTTLALANSGKGIAPSQTMDSTIYVPDNTSNPKNFCLQYRKGTNTYAVDNNSQPSSGVCLQNLVTNGDFSNGTTGWNTNSVSSFTTASNIASFSASAQYGYIISNTSVTVVGHKYYACAKVETSSNSLFFGFSSNAFVPYSGSGSFELKSILITATTASHDATIRDNRTSGWTQTRVQKVLAIDLTTAFGTGSEPTQTQMDTIITNYPNNWFNIVAKANL